jgi:hypothetical protein
MKASLSSLYAVIRWTATTLAMAGQTAHAAVTLNAADTFVVAGAQTGDLNLAGDLGVVKGIDFGTTASPPLAAVQLNYFGGTVNTAMTDLTAPLGTYQWRDNLMGTARDKMKLDGANILTLYPSTGAAAGILLNPNTGQVNLTGTAAGIYAGGNPVFTIGPGGNLAFGNQPLSSINTTPSISSTTGALTIAGGIGAAMDSTINGLKVGRGGGNVTTNTAYGSSALQSNTTGYCNTAEGYFALRSNTSGYYNKAAGAYALQANTTGYFNTAVGTLSLYANITGTNNTAIGNYSLLANTTGSLNTAAGSYALYANTAGGYNTASGYYSLRANTTAYYNTAAGAFSLAATTTGSANTAAGFYALSRNTTGACNNAAGSYALSSNTTGNYNLATGYYALYGNTTGVSNVAIGSYAGTYQATGAALTDPDNSVYIGANSRGLSNLDNNSIVIGFGATGEGANTTVIGNSSTQKTHLYGRVEASALTLNNAPVLTPSYGPGSSLSDYALLAMGESSQASGWGSIALGNYTSCTDEAFDSIAMSGGHATKGYAFAAGYGEVNGYLGIAVGTGVADGDSSIAMGGYDWQYGNWPGNRSSGENSVTLGGVGNQAWGFASLASGFWTRATSAHSVALGSLNSGLGTDAANWVETDPLLEVGNGNAPRSWEDPDPFTRSNALTTLKNGQTTLTNKAWKNNGSSPLADQDAAASGGEALVVEGHTRLKGRVIIEQPQGDISMGIYGQ